MRMIESEGVTTAWPWFPAVIEDIFAEPGFGPGSLSTVRSLGLIGAPELLRRAQELLPRAELLPSCGMTETGGTYAISRRSDSTEERATTMGVPEPGIDVRIVDTTTGADLPPDEMGEILVRGATIMDGYYKAEDGIDANGWVHTGDLYTSTASGHLVFKGRIKDMLKVGGENVAAVEVETFLCQHPAVKLAEVVGTTHPRLGEVPVAFIELAAGATLDPQDLIEFCGGQIATFKIPRAVHIVAAGEWPMSATKVDKQVLRQWASSAPSAVTR